MIKTVLSAIGTIVCALIVYWAWTNLGGGEGYTMRNVLRGAVIGGAFLPGLYFALMFLSSLVPTESSQDSDDSKDSRPQDSDDSSGPLAADSSDSEVVDDAEIYAFLHNSYSIWQAGVLRKLGDYYTEQTENADLEEITRNLLDNREYKELFENCFRLRAPEAGEFFVGMHPPGFMVTNKYLYIFEDKTLDKLHVIDLCDIKAIEYKAKILTTRCKLTLRNEGELLVTLSECPDDELIRKLQEMNGCEFLMEETPGPAS